MVNKIEIDWNKLDHLILKGLSQGEVCEELGISVPTFVRNFKKKFGTLYTNYRTDVIFNSKMEAKWQEDQKQKNQTFL